MKVESPKQACRALPPPFAQLQHSLPLTKQGAAALNHRVTPLTQPPPTHRHLSALRQQHTRRRQHPRPSSNPARRRFLTSSRTHLITHASMLRALLAHASKTLPLRHRRRPLQSRASPPPVKLWTRRPAPISSPPPLSLPLLKLPAHLLHLPRARRRRRAPRSLDRRTLTLMTFQSMCRSARCVFLCTHWLQ